MSIEQLQSSWLPKDTHDLAVTSKKPTVNSWVWMWRSSVFPALLRLPGCPGALAEISSQLSPDLAWLIPEEHFPPQDFPSLPSTCSTEFLVLCPPVKQVQLSGDKFSFSALKFKRGVCSVAGLPGFAPGEVGEGMERGVFGDPNYTRCNSPVEGRLKALPASCLQFLLHLGLNHYQK